MTEFIRLCASFLAAAVKSRAALQAENLALRHQLCVLQRSVKRPKVKPADRILWTLLARTWTGWRDTLIFVKPDTVIRWQRKRFKEHWRKLSQSDEPGRPPVADEVKELIRTMSSMNPTWGSPRIVGELAKLGISVNRSTVDKYKVCVRKPPSPTWRAFLKNHLKELVSVDFLVVPTVRFRILYVFLILSLERRRIIHFAVTGHLWLRKTRPCCWARTYSCCFVCWVRQFAAPFVTFFRFMKSRRWVRDRRGKNRIHGTVCRVLGGNVEVSCGASSGEPCIAASTVRVSAKCEKTEGEAG